ncbi:MAG: NAD(P)H-hydrate epimerase, partial [Desulfovibrionaceae bacterium]|nr:NAD(P)H-hydrate epimerase [Desulfovibrionaceae bacterium]
MMTAHDTFYSLLPPLPLPQEMRQWDKAAIALGLPEMLLMENAARAALAVMQKYFAPLGGKRIWLFMGGGNNGGDAACLARHLLDSGAEPLLLHSKPLAACTGASGRHLRLARAAGVTCTPLSRMRWPPEPDSLPHIVVDGLLGTGFRGPLRPELLKIIRRINTLAGHAPVLALDIPSGLDGLTGAPAPEAVRACRTVSFAAAKPGLMQPAARAWTGQVHVCPIGIPASVREAAPCSARLIDGHCLRALPPVAAAGHKNDSG